ncbi:MAG: response regulator [Myxococcaceae bacterium]
MTRPEAIAAVTSLIDQEKDRLVRAPREAPLPQLLELLAGLLKDGGEQGLASRGVNLGSDIAQPARALKALGQALLEAYGRLHGSIDPQVADVIAEVVGEASVAVQRSYAEALKGELSSVRAELRDKQGRMFGRMRSQALGQLAIAAAHAMNNLLNVLRLRLTLLRRDLRVEHLDALERTVNGLGELVAHLQEFSAARAEESLTEGDIDALIREAVAMARPGLERPRHPVQLSVKLEAGARSQLDEAFFRELLVNLLLAARDRMPAGGALLVLSTRSGDWIDLRIEYPGSYSSEDLALLFDPLRKSGTPQLSLLLAAARNQVQRWGGALGAEPIPGGAAFFLRLPIAASAAQAVRAPGPQVLGKRARGVLVVDDDVENARSMAEVLENEGYQVAAAFSGKQALALWDPERFDAALLDVLMPDMTGWQLARELRQRSPGVQLAVVSGAELRGQSRSNLALVDAVFMKPVDAAAIGKFLAREGPR